MDSGIKFLFYMAAKEINEDFGLNWYDYVMIRQ